MIFRLYMNTCDTYVLQNFAEIFHSSSTDLKCTDTKSCAQTWEQKLKEKFVGEDSRL